MAQTSHQYPALSVPEDRRKVLEDEFDKYIQGLCGTKKTNSIPITSLKLSDVKAIFQIKPSKSTRQTWHLCEDVEPIPLDYLSLPLSLPS